MAVLGDKQECVIDTCDNMDEAENNYALRKEPERKTEDIL